MRFRAGLSCCALSHAAALSRIRRSLGGCRTGGPLLFGSSGGGGVLAVVSLRRGHCWPTFAPTSGRCCSWRWSLGGPRSTMQGGSWCRCCCTAAILTARGSRAKAAPASWRPRPPLIRLTCGRGCQTLGGYCWNVRCAGPPHSPSPASAERRPSQEFPAESRRLYIVCGSLPCGRKCGPIHSEVHTSRFSSRSRQFEGFITVEGALAGSVGPQSSLPLPHGRATRCRCVGAGSAADPVHPTHRSLGRRGRRGWSGRGRTEGGSSRPRRRRTASRGRGQGPAGGARAARRRRDVVDWRANSSTERGCAPHGPSAACGCRSPPPSPGRRSACWLS